MNKHDYPHIPRAIYGITRGIERYYLRPVVKDLGKTALKRIKKGISNV